MSGIQSEIKQNKPFANAADEALIALQRTADVTTRSIAEFLKPFGVSPTQYNVLRILRGAGNAGLACGEIGERMITHEPDITRLLDRIQKAGWIERARDSKDRRVVTTRITKAGLNLLKTIDEPLREHNRRALRIMSEQDWRKLSELLQVVRKNLA